MHGEQCGAALRLIDKHRPDLFGRGVGVFPRVVGADAEDGEIGRADAFEGVGGGGVSSEEDACGGGGVFDEVRVEPAVVINGCACTPVGGFACGEAEIAATDATIPRELDDFGEAGGNQAARLSGGNDGRPLCRTGGEALERWAIEMVKVGVRDEDDVDLWEVINIDGGGDKARDAERDAAHAHADAMRKDRIGEDGLGTDAEQDAGVTDPAGRERVRGERSEIDAGNNGGAREACVAHGIEHVARVTPNA